MHISNPYIDKKLCNTEVHLYKRHKRKHLFPTNTDGINKQQISFLPNFIYAFSAILITISTKVYIKVHFKKNTRKAKKMKERRFMYGGE